MRFDAVAGVTTAAVVIPKSMAFATIAGLPVQAGLYVALVPVLVYALLGSSRPLSVSSTSTLAILTASALTLAVSGGDAAHLLAAAGTLALLVGGFLILAGLLRFGFLANFLSEPVLTGFKAGVGLLIVVDQVPKLLGLHIDKGHFFQEVLSILQHMPETSRATVILAAATLAILLGLEHFRPRAPAPLVAVVLGIAAAALLGLREVGVALTGPVPAGLPTPALPDLSLLSRLWPLHSVWRSCPSRSPSLPVVHSPGTTIRVPRQIESCSHWGPPMWWGASSNASPPAVEPPRRG